MIGRRIYVGCGWLIQYNHRGGEDTDGYHFAAPAIKREKKMDNNSNNIVVCENAQPAFSEFLINEGWLDPAGVVATIPDRITPPDLTDRTAYALGNLPLHLACLARQVIVFPLRGGRHGVKLTVIDLKSMVGRPVTYTVSAGPLPHQ